MYGYNPINGRFEYTSAQEVDLVLSNLSGWTTGVAYALDDEVVFNDAGVLKQYVCIEAHVAGDFATDLGANKWQEI